MADETALAKLVAGRDLGVLATIKRDGRPQLSTINYHYDEGRRLVRISITDDRAKARNLSRDPRASLHVSAPDGWSWAVAEGDAELSPVAADPHDAAVEELIELYRDIRGEHPDWDDYRRAMVADRRRVIRLRVARLYGQPPQG
ncbi:PPOX class F420-dependent oxidoreductase [Actinomadura rugatobispora]|uniref:PPOX class F420-dependent oxidoreductase n=1 Tax=Actinomadura rugatobispora TaxID=1994 RepID=A0ABW1A1F8_9ACTN|nr:PPOX class F420-dependent oxidoreductase [Actinomadura rugatobispora]